MWHCFRALKILSYYIALRLVTFLPLVTLFSSPEEVLSGSGDSITSHFHVSSSIKSALTCGNPTYRFTCLIFTSNPILYFKKSLASNFDDWVFRCRPHVTSEESSVAPSFSVGSARATVATRTKRSSSSPIPPPYSASTRTKTNSYSSGSFFNSQKRALLV